jgi:hypothetical protein
MDVDCRTCAYYTTQTGGCTSVVQCVDAMRYQPTAPRRYWLSSPVAAARTAIQIEFQAALDKAIDDTEMDGAAVEAKVRQRVLAAVEQRIRGWRQRHMNKSGDRLAIDDFMGQESIDDLVDYVCDEWA